MSTRLPDIAIARNAGWSKTLTFYKDKARTIPLVITGCIGKAQLRAAESRTSTLLADLGLEVVSESPVQIRLSMTLAQISALPDGEGYLDVLLAAAGGDPGRVCYTKMIIGDGVTVWP